MKTVTIAHKTVGEGSPVFIIAEAGCNHNGDINLAKKLVDVAVEAGADAVKFQTFITDETRYPTSWKGRATRSKTPGMAKNHNMPC